MNTKIEAVSQRSLRNAAQSEKADKFALTMKSIIDDLKAAELTIHGMAEELNKRRFRTPRGHFWSYASVSNVCARLDTIARRAKTAGVAEDEFCSSPTRPNCLIGGAISA